MSGAHNSVGVCWNQHFKELDRIMGLKPISLALKRTRAACIMLYVGINNEESISMSKVYKKYP